MTASTRILLCRLGCVLFCLVPTTFVGGWTCWRATSNFALAQRTDWEEALTERSGLIAEIYAVQYPSPGLARLEGVKLFHAETRQLVAAAAAVEITAHENSWHIELWQPQLHAAGLGELARLAGERLLRQPLRSQSSCQVVARELTIVRGQTAQSLLDFRLNYAPEAAGTELSCAFRLPEASPTAGPIRLLVSRNRQQTPPATQWQLDTAGQALPCDLLAEVLPEISRLGPTCRFAGAVNLTSSGREWSGQAAGRLAPLDLDALVTEQFPHFLSGQATLDIERATLDRGHLAGLQGTLRAAHGAVSPSLLVAAQQELGLTAHREPPSDSARAIPFQRLAVRFDVDGRTLQLVGDADPTQSGVLIASASGPLLSAAPQHQAPAISLLRALLPATELQVPAARQTSGLVNWLPIPDIDPAAVRAAAHTPIRLAPVAETPVPIRQPMMR